MASENFYIYMGDVDTPEMTWTFVPATGEARQKAMKEDYTGETIMSFAYEPESGKAEPVRKGPLILEFGNGKAPESSIETARKVIADLWNRYDLSPQALKYWINGGYGCQVEIPAEVFGAGGGDPCLPLIYLSMIRLLDLWEGGSLYIVNPAVCAMGRGYLLAHPNIKLADGRHRIPVSPSEFFDLDVQDLIVLAENPRIDFCPSTSTPYASKGLTNIYDLALELLRFVKRPDNSLIGLESLLSCAFVRHCYLSRMDLPKHEHEIMLAVLAQLGPAGWELAHEFNRARPNYVMAETDHQLRHLKSQTKLISCESIRDVFSCGQECQVRSPADLWRMKKSEEASNAAKFVLRADGVYHISHGDKDDAGQKICSPMKVIGKMCSPDGDGWARLVTIQAPDGQWKEVSIYMRYLAGRGDNVWSLLLDNGLEVVPSSKINQLLMEYIMSGAPDDTPLLCLSQIGWHGDVYVLPDEQFGGTLKGKIHFQGDSVESLHICSGSLAEWSQNIGEYCRGNPLLVLLTSYALTGPLLKRFDMEGGGLHLYGSSSSGKTTCALVAGSVCGGGPRGFLRQWRATHNALENTATLHNDNFLILDEISQATGETASQVAYMLTNGQGKERLKADASRRKTYRWRLNFLSTGEMTINEKIEEGGKISSLTGQEVRVINLPIQGQEGQNAFQDFHGYPGGSALSEMLSANACQYYGTPLRAFLKNYCPDMASHDEALKSFMESFVAEHCPAESSGQVKRVARKLALIAAVGELAAAFGVLPYENGESTQAAAKWFNIWLVQRDSLGDQEIEKVLKRIQDHFARHAGHYCNLDISDNNRHHQHLGYCWKQGDLKMFLMITPEFELLTKGAHRQIILMEMDKRGWLAHTSQGKLMVTKSVNGRNQRGIIFIPSAWEGTPEKEPEKPKIEESNVFGF